MTTFLRSLVNAVVLTVTLMPTVLLVSALAAGFR